MSEHHASRTVSCDAATLYRALCDVERWPQFLEGLDSVEPLGHHRYRWTVCFAGRTRPRPVDVVVTFDPRRQRVSWRHLTRPAFDGSFRLEAVSEQRTRVHLDLAPTPAGSLEGLYDVARMDHWDARRDLERLADALAAGPQPRASPAGGRRPGRFARVSPCLPVDRPQGVRAP